MSIKLMTVAWNLDLSHVDKLVLLKLCDNASDEGHCFPLIDTIAAKCCVDRRTVFRVLERLKDAGHITIKPRHMKSSVYIVHPKEVTVTESHPEQGDRESPTNQGGTQSPPGWQSATPRVAHSHLLGGTQSPIIITLPSSESPPNHQEEVASKTTLAPPAESCDSKGRKAKRSTAKKPATTWPTDFALTDARRAYVLMILPDADAPALFESYRLLCAAKDLAFADWDSAFMRHVRDLRPESGHFSAGQYAKQASTTPPPVVRMGGPHVGWNPAFLVKHSEREATDLKALMDRRSKVAGLRDFRDPYEAETADEYRRAQDTAWTKNRDLGKLPGGTLEAARS